MARTREKEKFDVFTEKEDLLEVLQRYLKFKRVAFKIENTVSQDVKAITYSTPRIEITVQRKVDQVLGQEQLTGQVIKIDTVFIPADSNNKKKIFTIKVLSH